MLGAFRGSPTKALELEAAVLPPELRFSYSKSRYCLRFLKFPPSHLITQEFGRTIGITNRPFGESDLRTYIPWKALFPTKTTLKEILEGVPTLIPKFNLESQVLNCP